LESMAATMSVVFTGIAAFVTNMARRDTESCVSVSGVSRFPNSGRALAGINRARNQ